MTSSDRPYQRLTRNASGLAKYTSLWLAADHLMIVSNSGYNESYVRVMLRDIRALWIVRTDRQMWWGIVWGIIGGFALVRAVVSLGMGDRPIGSGITAVVAALLWVWNSWLGAGCRVYFMTGVQTSTLPSLVRRRKATAVLARIQPLIAAAQAELAPAPGVGTADASAATAVLPPPPSP